MKRILLPLVVSLVWSCGSFEPTMPLDAGVSDADVCVPDEEPVNLNTEKCDGRDNDCDGVVDMVSCFAGDGSPGLRRCVNGKWEAKCVCGVVPHLPLSSCSPS